MFRRREPNQFIPTEPRCRTPFAQEYYPGFRHVNGDIVLHPTNGSSEIVLSERVA